MSSFAALIATIQANIKTNGNEEITGAVLQDVLEAMVDALGTEAINNLETDLAAEIQNRQNADTTLSNNIGANYASINAINGKIPSEASSSNKLTDKAYVDAADTALQTAINGIKSNIDNGYVYAGIATPSGTPVSGKVFYLAVTAGTYTNFGGLVVTQGINILKYNGTVWTQEQLIGIDDEPTAGSDNLVKSGGVATQTGELLYHNLAIDPNTDYKDYMSVHGINSNGTENSDEAQRHFIVKILPDTDKLTYNGITGITSFCWYKNFPNLKTGFENNGIDTRTFSRDVVVGANYCVLVIQAQFITASPITIWQNYQSFPTLMKHESLSSKEEKYIFKAGNNSFNFFLGRYNFIGVAAKNFNPATPEGRVAYFASQEGTYTYFGGLKIEKGYPAYIIGEKVNGSAVWKKLLLNGINTLNRGVLSSDGSAPDSYEGAVTDYISLNCLNSITVDATYYNKYRISYYDRNKNFIGRLPESAEGSVPSGGIITLKNILDLKFDNNTPIYNGEYIRLSLRSYNGESYDVIDLLDIRSFIDMSLRPESNIIHVDDKAVVISDYEHETLCQCPSVSMDKDNPDGNVFVTYYQSGTIYNEHSDNPTVYDKTIKFNLCNPTKQIASADLLKAGETVGDYTANANYAGSYDSSTIIVNHELYAFFVSQKAGEAENRRIVLRKSNLSLELEGEIIEPTLTYNDGNNDVTITFDKASLDAMIAILYSRNDLTIGNFPVMGNIISFGGKYYSLLTGVVIGNALGPMGILIKSSDLVSWEVVSHIPDILRSDLGYNNMEGTIAASGNKIYVVLRIAYYPVFWYDISTNKWSFLETGTYARPNQLVSAADSSRPELIVKGDFVYAFVNARPLTTLPNGSCTRTALDVVKMDKNLNEVDRFRMISRFGLTYIRVFQSTCETYMVCAGNRRFPWNPSAANLPHYPQSDIELIPLDFI